MASRRLLRRRSATTDLPEATGDRNPSAPAEDEGPGGEGADGAHVAAPERDGPRIGELLVRRGVLTPAQVDEALLQQAASGRLLGTLLLELGMVDERALIEALAEQLDLPVADLRQGEPDPEAAARVPEALARSLGVVAVSRSEGTLLIAAGDPGNPCVLEEVGRAVAPDRVRLAIAAPSDIRRAIDSAYRALAGVGSLVEAFKATETGRALSSDARVVSEDAPVVHLVNLMLTQGLRDRASDIHIEPHADRVRVRYRIDGALHDVLSLPETMGPSVVSRIKIMANMNIVDRRRPQDGQIATEIDGRSVDIRVSTTPTIWGEKAVLRLLDSNRTLLRLAELGMPAATYARFSSLLRSPYGMVACGGPTGSGKTTTLYATLGELNQSERNITTIEDPVEYMFPSVNQIQINDQAGITFATGLRSILRQDPDVILVGEIRDAETARIAVESALTGHFVLSSIHAADACSALHRFVDMGIEPFLITSTVAGVVSQRLVRRICDHCREPLPAGRGRTGLLRAGRRVHRRRVLAGPGLQLLLAHGLPGADRRLRTARDERRGQTPARGEGIDRPAARGRPGAGHGEPAGRRGPAGGGGGHDHRRDHVQRVRGLTPGPRPTPVAP
ncbi:GspE/PulE family protein (plasmid) [Streptomyces sp. BI20]|uniref:GspE/PulE family protein n=1 Tax=Streptomyces sp. BI20 TaxID=3403460 RepID=UPI003C72F741